MKILEINKFYYLKGGAEKYFFSVSDLLRNMGHEVIHLSMENKNNLKTDFKSYFIKEVDLSKLNLINVIKFFYNYEAVKLLEEIIKKEKPDIAHLHNIAHQFSPAIIKVLKKNNIKIVQTLHDYKLICPNYKLFSCGKICNKCRGGKYYNCFLKNCFGNPAKSFLGSIEAYFNKKKYDQIDLFITPSEYLKKSCMDFGIDENKILVIRNFIESAELWESAAGNYLFYFGRISEEKGIKVLIEAMSKLKNEELKIAGDGPELDSLKAEVSKRGIKNISFLGKKDNPELKELIRSAKAIIIPSLWPENAPYSLLESMAAGKAVIASGVGGINELIKNPKNGFLVPAGNISELVKTVESLNKFDLDEIGKSARFSVENLSKKNHARELISALQRALTF